MGTVAKAPLRENWRLVLRDRAAANLPAARGADDGRSAAWYQQQPLPSTSQQDVEQLLRSSGAAAVRLLVSVPMRGPAGTPAPGSPARASAALQAASDIHPPSVSWRPCCCLTPSTPPTGQPGAMPLATTGQPRAPCQRVSIAAAVRLRSGGYAGRLPDPQAHQTLPFEHATPAAPV